jgi:hypothetical protein
MSEKRFFNKQLINTSGYFSLDIFHGEGNYRLYWKLNLNGIKRKIKPNLYQIIEIFDVIFFTFD